MLWQVDPSTRTPLFEQVAGSVRAAIASGELTVGSRLPAAKEVAGSLDIHLHTVLRAYRVLRDEGLLDLRRGRGAVVVGADTAGQARLRTLLHDLLAEGRRQGLAPADVAHLIREEQP